jgi:hypothetical protein
MSGMDTKRRRSMARVMLMPDLYHKMPDVYHNMPDLSHKMPDLNHEMPDLNTHGC